MELPKFQKSLETLETLTDRWLYFLKEAETSTLMPDSLSNTLPLRRALEVANLSSLSPEELDLVEGQQIAQRDRRNAVIYAEPAGEARGEARREVNRRRLKKLPDRCWVVCPWKTLATLRGYRSSLSRTSSPKPQM